MRIRLINSCLISSEIDVWHRMLMALSNQLIVNHTAASSACIIIIYHLPKIESRYGVERKKKHFGCAFVCANVERICMKIMAHLTKLLWSHHRSDETFRCLIGFRWLPQWSGSIAQGPAHDTHTHTHMWRGRKEGMNARSFVGESNTFGWMGDECCGNIFSMNLWLLIKVKWNVACSGTRAAQIRSNYACRMCCEMCETTNDDMWEWATISCYAYLVPIENSIYLFSWNACAYSPPARTNRCVADFCSATFTCSATATDDDRRCENWARQVRNVIAAMLSHCFIHLHESNSVAGFPFFFSLKRQKNRCVLLFQLPAVEQNDFWFYHPYTAFKFAGFGMSICIRGPLWPANSWWFLISFRWHKFLLGFWEFST